MTEPDPLTGLALLRIVTRQPMAVGGALPFTVVVVMRMTMRRIYWNLFSSSVTYWNCSNAKRRKMTAARCSDVLVKHPWLMQLVSSRGAYFVPNEWNVAVYSPGIAEGVYGTISPNEFHLLLESNRLKVVRTNDGDKYRLSGWNDGTD